MSKKFVWSAEYLALKALDKELKTACSSMPYAKFCRDYRFNQEGLQALTKLVRYLKNFELNNQMVHNLEIADATRFSIWTAASYWAKQYNNQVKHIQAELCYWDSYGTKGLSELKLSSLVYAPKEGFSFGPAMSYQDIKAKKKAETAKVVSTASAIQKRLDASLTPVQKELLAELKKLNVAFKY